MVAVAPGPDDDDEPPRGDRAQRGEDGLDGVEEELEGRSVELRMRYLLERGRTLNSSGRRNMIEFWLVSRLCDY